MPKNLVFIGMIVFCAPLLTLAQEPNRVGDETAITQVIQYYFQAMTNNDAETLKQAVHSRAKWLNAGHKGHLSEISFDRVAANMQSNARRQMPKSNAALKIAAIDITGGVASAKIETEYLTTGPAEVLPKLAVKGGRITEYLSLIKFDNGWKIVSRIYSGAPTASPSPLQPDGDQR